MAKAGQLKCLNCGEFFFPDHRKGRRQKFCSTPECRRASKAASQAAWLAKPQNRDYFSHPTHVARVQAWRAAHPGYSRAKERPSKALQDLLTTQGDDFIEESSKRGAPPPGPDRTALQDLLTPSAPILAGLIAHLFELSLQDEMASTARRLVQLGEDLIKQGGSDEDSQTGVAPRAAAPGARAVQLG